MREGLPIWVRALALVVVLGTTACPPSVSDEAVLVHYSGAGFETLSVSGWGFADPQADSYLEVVPAVGETIVVASQAPEVLQWAQSHIVVTFAAGTGPVSVRVHTSEGFSETEAAVVEYDAHFFSTRDAPGHPTTLIGDATGRIFVNSEYHNNVSAWDPAAGVVIPFVDYPLPAVPIYHICVYKMGNCGTSRVATFGEGVAADSLGRVWFTEGGAEPQRPPATQPNHSRLLAVETDADPVGTLSALRLYNLPGDRNSVIGVAWDEARQRIWFSQTGTLDSGKLVSFDPDGIVHDDFAFDWTTTATCDVPTGATQGTCSNAAWHACTSTSDCVLAEQICPPGVVDDSACYHEYPVPAYQPAHVAAHPDGSIWYANYFLGGDIGRLDPSTGAVSRFPLGSAADGYGLAWPWQVRVAENGDVWASEFMTDRLLRIPVEKQLDGCESLVDTAGEVDCEFAPDGYRSPSCRNPCVEEFEIPGAWIMEEDGTFSSPMQNLWFDLGPDDRVYFDQGYRLPNGHFVFWPRLLEMFPSPDGVSPPYAGKGVYVAPDRVVWLTDFKGKRLLRLTPRP